MSKKTGKQLRRNTPLGAYGSADTPERVAERMAHLRSGAAGIHDDQKTRHYQAAGHTNRIGSRSSARTAAIRDYA